MSDFWVKEAVSILRQNGSRECAEAVGALAARLAEAERARDSAFETWKKLHQTTLAAFIKNEHDPIKARLAEAEAALASATVDTWWAKAYFKKYPRAAERLADSASLTLKNGETAERVIVSDCEGNILSATPWEKTHTDQPDGAAK